VSAPDIFDVTDLIRATLNLFLGDHPDLEDRDVEVLEFEQVPPLHYLGVKIDGTRFTLTVTEGKPS
jgi:hypothetical protein